MTRLLTSVRNLSEAREAAAAGADFIDLKEPRAGALGALPPARVERIVNALRETWPRLPISATIGDLAPGDDAAIEFNANRIGRCGVDFVKAGVCARPHARETLACMRSLRWNMVPVLLADDGLDLALVEYACQLGFSAVMVDTARKQQGSLFDRVPLDVLDAMVRIAHDRGVMAGLAGSLRIEHVARVHALAPDFAGFRGALCDDSRTGRLKAARVCAVRAALSGTAQDKPAALLPEPHDTVA